MLPLQAWLGKSCPGPEALVCTPQRVSLKPRPPAQVVGLNLGPGPAELLSQPSR